MKPDFMEKLQELRNLYGKAMTITSGYRDVTHPVEAKKAQAGVHTLGIACDVACNGNEAFLLMKYAVMVGFTGIGVSQKGNARFIHLDTHEGTYALIYGVIKMLGILAKIFGSGEVVKEGLKLIDDIHTSTEEEIASKTQQRVQIMKAYAPFKIAQRFLALMFGCTFLASYVLVLGMTVSADYGDTDAVTAVMDQFSINYAMLIILGFYFGGGVIDSVKAKNNLAYTPDAPAVTHFSASAFIFAITHCIAHTIGVILSFTKNAVANFHFIYLKPS